MSECVVRMEMPQSCPCELAGGYDIPLPCFAGRGVPKRCKEFDECVEKGTKPDWCPFVCALPEKHGNLVDVGEDASKYITVWDCNCSEFGKQTVMAVDDLNYLPTIVPATEGGKE